MRVISPATMGVPTTVLASTASRIRWMVSDMSSLTGWFFSMVCFPFPFRGGGGRLLALFSTVANGFHHRPPQGEDDGQQLGYRQRQGRPEGEPGLVQLIVQIQGEVPVFDQKVGLQKGGDGLRRPPGLAVMDGRVGGVRLPPLQVQGEVVDAQPPGGTGPPLPSRQAAGPGPSPRAPPRVGLSGSSWVGFWAFFSALRAFFSWRLAALWGSMG